MQTANMLDVQINAECSHCCIPTSRQGLFKVCCKWVPEVAHVAQFGTIETSSSSFPYILAGLLLGLQGLHAAATCSFFIAPAGAVVPQKAFKDAHTSTLSLYDDPPEDVMYPRTST